ncbi:NAD(P)H-hydrate dehydratase [Pedobacter frigiditerrae]|uniref:Bifunctional NAD(P)H-hydrate repair enzyme n=2 Tax=Pedobacter frigiditerrae TaxID=2530452 RepID=A0A4R0N8Q5_9SPHI|nr:NAD(P)H-hydrate dehydratase [Pedobacter frigiditerrae]
MQEADNYVIINQPISSINLMENASKAFCKLFKKEVLDKEAQLSILCGQGNNGGDGLAIARLLHNDKYKNISVYVIKFADSQSEGNKQNVKRLLKLKVPVTIVQNAVKLKELKADIIIDAMLGSGLNKPLKDDYADLVALVNASKARIISVDVPTGFATEGEIPENYNGIKADLVISFQRPKINFFFPESVEAFYRYKIVDIGLDENFIQGLTSNWKLLKNADIKALIKPRANFSHKGTYGHALLVAGNTTTMGAAILVASACLNAGAGLTTVCLPQSGLIALNTTLPEVMALPRNEHLAIEDFDKFNVIAIGPGLGLEPENEELFEKIINLNKPIIVDADGLTILSKRKDLLDKLPAESILTPHVKEFDRLFGEHKNWWGRIKTAQKEAKERDLIIVLKNQYTFICLPTGEVRINPTGNPAIASGGMGDVLTGIITAFMAQGYSSEDAATLAVYIHGKAGDKLAENKFVVSAHQVALQIPKTMKDSLS